ncbi:hypothetical protein EGK75_07570 [Neisseria weixii]|uniref:Uncharacterized protein n=1 Tax=Neisseria weixii TaxID=1853276 RepID=A0A3N4N4H6_9NEIS|nr:hypothetical protein [Neisseria weixii]RPD86229.1 hypothetical protein EGK74_08285 [Neisseria weixii]RPD87213.1 hypothetical protein EGK75_07570 [Neisseria weixii]
MKLIDRINQFIDAAGAAIKGIRADVGQKTNLQTTDKNSLVGAINELKGMVDSNQAAGGALIDDVSAASATTVYSSQKTEQLIAAEGQNIRNQILDGADTAYDTLKEIGDYIKEDKSGAATMAEQIGKRLRIDEAQELTPEQKTAVETTLNLGDTDTDFAARFKAALK